jgi:predicted small metal-binding protein
VIRPQIWILKRVLANVSPRVAQHGGDLIIVRLAGPPPKGAVMAKAIRCECGYVASGDTDDQVIEAIRAHMATDHPQLLEKVTREDLFGWIEDV